jgi:hypothetical protein
LLSESKLQCGWGLNFSCLFVKHRKRYGEKNTQNYIKKVCDDILTKGVHECSTSLPGVAIVVLVLHPVPFL